MFTRRSLFPNMAAAIAALLNPVQAATQKNPQVSTSSSEDIRIAVDILYSALLSNIPGQFKKSFDLLSRTEGLNMRDVAHGRLDAAAYGNMCNETLLITACFKGHAQAAEILLEAGADANATDGHGVDALFSTIFNARFSSADDRVAIIEALAGKGVDFNAPRALKYEQGVTPLMAFVNGVKPVQMFDALVRHGADIRASFSLQGTSLWTPQTETLLELARAKRCGSYSDTVTRLEQFVGKSSSRSTIAPPA